MVEGIAIQYGLPVLILGVLFYMIKWTHGLMGDVLMQAKSEREQFLATIDTLSETIRCNIDMQKEVRADVREAHKHQRQEHKSQIVLLTDLTKSADRIVASMTAVCTKLESLNGKK